MDSNRKRFNSSMTYNEYFETYQKPPAKPIIRPQNEPQVEMPDLSLNNPLTRREEYKENTKLSKAQINIFEKLDNIYRPKIVFNEDDEPDSLALSNQNSMSKGSKRKIFIDQKLETKIQGRMRFKSETINFTFMSFLERNLERRQSKDGFNQIM